jgi:hypothetical protein
MPVPQRVDFLVERAPEPVHKRLIDKGATSQFQLSRTGKMPVPQRVDFLVERTSCQFIKSLLTMVQHLNFN